MEKPQIKTYRDLIVWQKAHVLAKKVLAISRNFPQTEEAKLIRTQLIKSSTSVPANIAEGFGGNKGKVFKNCLTIAGVRRVKPTTGYC